MMNSVFFCCLCFTRNYIKFFWFWGKEIYFLRIKRGKSKRSPTTSLSMRLAGRNLRLAREKSSLGSHIRSRVAVSKSL